jgi:hypothetical protein
LPFRRAPASPGRRALAGLTLLSIALLVVPGAAQAGGGTKISFHPRFPGYVVESSSSSLYGCATRYSQPVHPQFKNRTGEALASSDLIVGACATSPSSTFLSSTTADVGVQAVSFAAWRTGVVHLAIAWTVSGLLNLSAGVANFTSPAAAEGSISAFAEVVGCYPGSPTCLPGLTLASNNWSEALAVSAGHRLVAVTNATVTLFVNASVRMGYGYGIETYLTLGSEVAVTGNGGSSGYARVALATPTATSRLLSITVK